jgi:hypothetical protein
MSNSVVGGVYQTIIEKVIQTSQNDFEESGVDHNTLDEMKQVCCNLASASQPSRLSFLCRSTTAVPSPHRLLYFSLSLSNILSHHFRWLQRSRNGRLAWDVGRLKAGRSCRSVWQLRGRLSIWVTFL